MPHLTNARTSADSRTYIVARMVTIHRVPAWSSKVMADSGGAAPRPCCALMNRTDEDQIKVPEDGFALERNVVTTCTVTYRTAHMPYPSRRSYRPLHATNSAFSCAVISLAITCAPAYSGRSALVPKGRCALVEGAETIP